MAEVRSFETLDRESYTLINKGAVLLNCYNFIFSNNLIVTNKAFEKMLC